jgi:hypothetical protein
MNSTGTLLYTTSKVVSAGLQHFESAAIWPALGDLPEGIYYLRVISDRSTGVKRIIKIG